MYECYDKVVLVTGAAAGIGAEIVEAFLKEGVKHVAVLDINVKDGKAFEEKLKDKYGEKKVKFHKCDVTTDELNEAYEYIVKNFGHIDVVVNNAGIMNDSPSTYLKEVEINVSALIKSSFKAYELMRKDHGGIGGTIINVSSIAGIHQSPLVPVYYATKSAVLQFSNCLGMEPHYGRSNVRLLTICFGCTDTSLFSTSKMGTLDEESKQLLLDTLKNRPFQTPESAAKGLIHAFKHGASASTWIVTSDRPAKDISDKVTKAYEMMSQGIFD